ncbi:MAG: hypothetical protein JWO31_2340, partial [Phycisphaerales bacterium]|nr:hypothetical protein [Phycisphaerales bacterium]
MSNLPRDPITSKRFTTTTLRDPDTGRAVTCRLDPAGYALPRRHRVALA